MRITNAGNVGIGTSSPIDLLSVGNSTTADQRISLFSNATSDNESYGSILFRFNNANGNKNAKISALRKTNSSGGELVFYTRTPSDAVNDDGGEERMRIDSSGNVGIGTTSPDQKLEVAGNAKLSGTAPILYLEETDASADNKTWVVQASAEELKWSARTDAGVGGGNNFALTRSAEQVNTFEGRNSGNAWFIVDNANQKVGIGTTSPNRNLSISGDNPIIGLTDTDGGDEFFARGS